MADGVQKLPDFPDHLKIFLVPFPGVRKPVSQLGDATGHACLINRSALAQLAGSVGADR
jgi:hypothetical protein